MKPLQSLSEKLKVAEAIAGLKKEEPVITLVMQPLLGHGGVLRPEVDRDIESESPSARLMVFMKAQGWNDARIARELNVSQSLVSRTTRQEWFQQNLLNLLAEMGTDKIRELVRIYSTDALHLVYNMMATASKEDSRIKCAFKLLDLEHGSKVKIEAAPKEDVKRLDEEIAALQEQLNATGGTRLVLPE